MSERLRMRLRAVVVAVAPLVLLAGALVHPFVGNLPGAADLAAAVTNTPGRWAAGHLLLGVGVAVVLLLFFVIRTYLRGLGEERWSFWAVGLATIGLGLFAFMVGAEGLGGRAALATGDLEAFFEEMELWALPIFLVANVLVGLGLLGFATGIAKTGVLGTGWTRLMVAAAIVAVIALFLPFGWAAHLIAVAMIVFAWPVAATIWSVANQEPGAEN